MTGKSLLPILVLVGVGAAAIWYFGKNRNGMQNNTEGDYVPIPEGIIIPSQAYNSHTSIYDVNIYPRQLPEYRARGEF